MTREPSPDQLRELKLLVEEHMQFGNASKRARDVARIILEQGSCTTSDIEKLGYKHAPRAVGDLRDSGVQVVKEMEAFYFNLSFRVLISLIRWIFFEL